MYNKIPSDNSQRVSTQMDTDSVAHVMGIITTPSRRSQRTAIETPEKINAFMDQLFPVSGARPMVMYGSSPFGSCVHRLYTAPKKMETHLSPHQHWVVFNAQGDVPTQYSSRVLSWTAIHVRGKEKRESTKHVATCK